jgi:hypothetical protein
MLQWGLYGGSASRARDKVCFVTPASIDYCSKKALSQPISRGQCKWATYLRQHAPPHPAEQQQGLQNACGPWRRCAALGTVLVRHDVSLCCFMPLQSSLSADQLESALLDPRSNTSLVGDLVYRLAHRCEQYNTTFQVRAPALLGNLPPMRGCTTQPFKCLRLHCWASPQNLQPHVAHWNGEHWSAVGD